jgi:hypothetical protein
LSARPFGEKTANAQKEEREMRKTFFVLLMAISMSATEGQGADWKFFGGSTLAKGEKVLCYYDTETVEPLHGGNTRVWTKAIKQTDIEKILAKQDKQIIKATAEKYAGGYLPPYLLGANAYDRGEHMEVIAWEEAANNLDIPPRMRILFELNCNEKKIQILSATYYENNSKVKSESNSGRWDYISPETNAETLCRILSKGTK